MPENIRAMKNAFESLIENNVITDYDAEPIKEKRKITDVRYTIRPHPEFVKQVMKANTHQKKTKLKSLDPELIDHDIIHD